MSRISAAARVCAVAALSAFTAAVAAPVAGAAETPTFGPAPAGPELGVTKLVSARNLGGGDIAYVTRRTTANSPNVAAAYDPDDTTSFQTYHAPRTGNCFTDTFSVHAKGAEILGHGNEQWRVTLKKTWCVRGGRIVRTKQRGTQFTHGSWGLIPAHPRFKTRKKGRSRQTSTTSFIAASKGTSVNAQGVTVPIGESYSVLFGLDYRSNGNLFIIWDAPHGAAGRG